MIEMRNVSVIYDQNISALQSIDLKLEKKRYAIIGQNGSGKSTFLQTLVGIVDMKGEVIIDGIVLNDKHLKLIRNKVGLVFQNPDHQLFMSHIYDDLAFGLINMGLDKEKINEKIQDIALKLHIDHLLDRSCHKLSGGQKRMAAIASILVMEPEIILMDEPSSFLDPKSRREVIQIIKNLDKTLIIATHDLDMALEVSDEVILLNEGKVIAVGPTDMILKDKKLLEDNGLELPFCYQR